MFTKTIQQLYVQSGTPQDDTFNVEDIVLRELTGGSGDYGALTSTVPSLNAVPADKITPGSLVRHTTRNVVSNVCFQVQHNPSHPMFTHALTGSIPLYGAGPDGARVLHGLLPGL